MTWVVGPINPAAQGFSMAGSSLKRLIRMGWLDGDADCDPRDGWVGYDDGWSRRDIWDRARASGFEFADEGELRSAIWAKHALHRNHEPYPDDFLVSMGRVRGGRALSARESEKLLGASASVAAAARRRYNELVGCSNGGAGPRPPEVDLEELLDDAPDWLARLRGSCRDPDRGVLFERPALAATSLAARVPPGPWRSLATMVALLREGGSVKNRERTRAIIAMIRDLSSGSDPLPPADPRVALAVEAMAAAEATGGRRVTSGTAWVELCDLVSAWLDWQQVDPGDRSGFDPEVAPAPVSQAALRRFRADTERVDAATLSRRALMAGDIAGRASHRLLSVDARFRQWDRLANVIEDAMARVLHELDAGGRVPFPVGVSDTYKVVRPDGTVPTGLRQRVRFEIWSEETLWLLAWRSSGYQVEANMARGFKGLVTATKAARIAAWESGAGAIGSPFMRQGGDRRLYAVYVATEPVEAGEEHHAPFLVAAYAVSALADSAVHSVDMRAARSAFVDASGLPHYARRLTGLTWWAEERVGDLPAYVLRHAGRIIMPHRELRLLLAYGRAAIRLELLSGLRIGETMQVRKGGGCFAPAEVGGRRFFKMRGRPKGWPRDRLWAVDAPTVALLRQIGRWAVQTLYPGTSDLPIVPYAQPGKNSRRLVCPPARYLLQLGGRAAQVWELNLCIRLATLGMVHANSHDYRYAFAKLLKVRGATRMQRARALSHLPGSTVPDRYADWECEGLEPDDLVVAEAHEAMELAALEAMIDAG